MQFSKQTFFKDYKLNYFRECIILCKNVIGTTQSKPKKSIINPGGFTDGDRILFFLKNIVKPFQKIFLIGMDFDKKVGKYSKLNIKENHYSTPIKRKKLKYAVRLLESLIDEMKNEIYFVNSKYISSKFNYLSLIDFINYIRT